MLASFIIALLTGMGVGSGGLFVVYLTLVKDTPQLLAQGLNLYFFIFSTATATVIHSLSNPLVRLRLLTVCGFGGIGCVFGAILAQNTNAGMLRTVFAFLMIFAGVVSFVRKK